MQGQVRRVTVSSSIVATVDASRLLDVLKGTGFRVVSRETIGIGLFLDDNLMLSALLRPPHSALHEGLN